MLPDNFSRDTLHAYLPDEKYLDKPQQVSITDRGTEWLSVTASKFHDAWLGMLGSDAGPSDLHEKVEQVRERLLDKDDVASSSMPADSEAAYEGGQYYHQSDDSSQK